MDTYFGSSHVRATASKPLGQLPVEDMDCGSMMFEMHLRRFGHSSCRCHDTGHVMVGGLYCVNVDWNGFPEEIHVAHTTDASKISIGGLSGMVSLKQIDWIDFCNKIPNIWHLWVQRSSRDV
jgi:Leu/Phe-tRNA-protein transferase